MSPRANPSSRTDSLWPIELPAFSGCAGVYTAPLINVTPGHLPEDSGADGLLDVIQEEVLKRAMKFNITEKDLDKKFRIRLRKG